MLRRLCTKDVLNYFLVFEIGFYKFYFDYITIALF